MADTRYLAIETSSPRLSLALGDESTILKVYQGPHEWRHAESLFDGVQQLLKKARWTVQSLTGVAVSIGPGSFTGIRIGLACARAMGQSLKIPVVGVSSLEVMAAGARTKAVWRAPRIDALRGMIFTALYQDSAKGIRRVIAEKMVDPKAWEKEMRRKTGREPVWVPALGSVTPDAGVLLALARPRLARAGPMSYEDALPLYIRRSSAEERRG